MSQFRLDPPEMELFRELRQLNKDAKPQNQYEEHLLQQTLNFICYAGDRRLGFFDIDASHAIVELAAVGAKVMGILKSDEWSAPMPAASDDAMEYERDSVFGTQSVGEQDDLSSEDDGQGPPWEWFHRTLPSYVKKVWFIVEEQDMTASHMEELEARYPDAIVHAPTPLQMEEVLDLVPSEAEKHMVAKRAWFEVDREEPERDPQTSGSNLKALPRVGLRPERSRLQSSQRENVPITISPPITIEPISETPDTKSIPIVKQPADSNNRMSLRSSFVEPDTRDVFLTKHLELFSKYVKTPPQDNEFGYNFRISDRWEGLSLERREAIAHARCIQGSFGEFAKMMKIQKCTSCTASGYSCRVYKTFPVLPNMDMGYACQNCRVWDLNCDCAASTKPTLTRATNGVAPGMNDSSFAQKPTPISATKKKTLRRSFIRQ